MDKKVTAHILAFNEERIIYYAVKHYRSFCCKVVLHDLGSTDSTQQIAQAQGAELVQHNCEGVTDDILNSHIKNTCWHNDKSDWVVCADADELIYLPQGVEVTLNEYERQQLAIIKPHGWEMTSETFPTTYGQIYDEVKWGARDDHWYAKPILFSRRRVAKTEIGMGAHEVSVTLHDGSRIHVPQGTPPTSPPCWLLHMHHLGSVEEIGRGYDGIIKRHGAMNKKMGWGIQAEPLQHARDKRKYIMDRLEQVIK